MPPEDRERLKSDQRKIGRTLEQNRAVLDLARSKSGKYSHTLSISGAQARSARNDLQRAGYLKKPR
jgi:hypothetical protein